MKIVALTLPIREFGKKELKDTLCLCVHSDPENLTKMFSNYPIDGYDEFIRYEGLEYRVVCVISKRAKCVDGEEFTPEQLNWCDPKALTGFPVIPEYFPFEKYLYEKRPAWICSEIFVKRMVERIL